MANEIAYRLTIKSTKDSAVEEFPPVSPSFPQTTQGADGGIVSVGTSEEVLTIT